MDMESNDKICFKGIDGDRMPKDSKSNRSWKELENHPEYVKYPQNIAIDISSDSIEKEGRTMRDKKGSKEEEEMLKHLENLKLAEENHLVEVEDDDIDDANKDFKNAIACKILTAKYINPEVFSTMMPRIWGIEGLVKIEKVGANAYLCKFRRIRDKARVIKGGPWSYDDVILVFEEPKGSSSVELNFIFIFFWINFHKLPRVCFCRKYVEALGNVIGCFEYVECDEYGKMEGETLRVKIRINVEEPLKRGTNIKIGSMAEKTWIPITYEKFPDFCYYCGKLGHVFQECSESGVDSSKEKVYGVELRETKSSKGVYKNWKPEYKDNSGWFRGRGRRRGGRNARGGFNIQREEEEKGEWEKPHQQNNRKDTRPQEQRRTKKGRCREEINDKMNLDERSKTEGIKLKKMTDCRRLQTTTTFSTLRWTFRRGGKDKLKRSLTSRKIIPEKSKI